MNIVYMVLQNELAAQRQDFGFAKEKSFQKKVKVEKQAYIAKMTSAEQTKEEKLENEQRLAEYRLTRRLSALEKKDAVKKSMMKSQRKLDSYRMQKIQAVSYATFSLHCTINNEGLLRASAPAVLLGSLSGQLHHNDATPCGSSTRQTFSNNVQHGILVQKDLAFHTPH